MRVNTLPTAPIALDAYYIQSAIVRKKDLVKTQSRVSRSAAVRIQEDIFRITGVIEARVAEWISKYGTDTVWTQHLDGTKYDNKAAN